MSIRRLLGICAGGLSIGACAAALALAGAASAGQSIVTFAMAADLHAGGAGDEVAGSSTMRYRCESRRRVGNRIWFERRAGSDAAWERIEPDGADRTLARFADRRRAGGRVLRASVRAPRSSFAGAGAAEFRLRSRMTFSCTGHKIVARSQTLPLPGLGA